MVPHMAQKMATLLKRMWDASDISGESIGTGWIRFDSAFGGVDNHPRQLSNG